MSKPRTLVLWGCHMLRQRLLPHNRLAREMGTANEGCCPLSDNDLRGASIASYVRRIEFTLYAWGGGSIVTPKRIDQCANESLVNSRNRPVQRQTSLSPQFNVLAAKMTGTTCLVQFTVRNICCHDPYDPGCQSDIGGSPPAPTPGPSSSLG